MTIAGDLYLAEGIGKDKSLKVTVRRYCSQRWWHQYHHWLPISRLIIIKEGNKVEYWQQVAAINETYNLGHARTKESYRRRIWLCNHEGLDGDALVELIGNFESLEIRAEGIQVQTSGGTIENLVAQGATNVNIDLARGLNVTNLTTNAPTVTGTGNIRQHK